MKAIHNLRTGYETKLATVFNTSKIQNESNSQLVLVILYNLFLLCLIHQRYKMKAIHNVSQTDNSLFGTVFNTSKIQNESNSQLNSVV